MEAKRPSVLASQEKVVQAKRNHNDPRAQEKRFYLCVRVEIEGCIRAFDRNQQVAIRRRNHWHGHHVGSVRLNLHLDRKEMAWVELLSWERTFLGSERLTTDLRMYFSSALRCDLACEALTH